MIPKCRLETVLLMARGQALTRFPTHLCQSASDFPLYSTITNNYRMMFYCPKTVETYSKSYFTESYVGPSSNQGSMGSSNLLSKRNQGAPFRFH